MSSDASTTLVGGGAVVCEDLAVVRPSGRRLAGTLTIPAGASSSPPSSSSSSTFSPPVVVLLHGLLSNKDHNFAPLLADSLSRRLGVHTYRFDFRTGPCPEEPAFRYRFCGFDEDLDDTQCAVEMLRGKGFRVVAVVGHSRGGNIALMYGASLANHQPPASSSPSSAPPPPAILALSPRFRVPGMLDKFTAEQLAILSEGDGGTFSWAAKGTGFSGDVVVTRDDVEYVRKFDMARIVASIPPNVPVLFAHGNADKTIPSDDSKLAAETRLAAVRGDSAAEAATELHLFGGANHVYQGSKLTEKLISMVASFVAKHTPGISAVASAGAAAGQDTPSSAASSSPVDAAAGAGAGKGGKAGKPPKGSGEEGGAAAAAAEGEGEGGGSNGKGKKGKSKTSSTPAEEKASASAVAAVLGAIAEASPQGSEARWRSSAGAMRWMGVMV